MRKCKITGKALVIQLGNQESQFVLMDNGGQILHSAVAATPAGAVEDGTIWNKEAVLTMVKETTALPEFRRVRNVVFSLCTSQVITETITTPDLPEAKLEKLVRANADMHFPVDIQDYNLVWQVIGPKTREDGQKELAVQLWAIPNNMLSRYYFVANSCGLSVSAIDYCGNSIANAVGASFAQPAKARKKSSLNADISLGRKKKNGEDAGGSVATQTRHTPDTDLHLTLEKNLIGMTFVQDHQVVFQRFIRCGVQPSYQFDEIAMMVEYFRSMETGRGSRIRGIVSGTLASYPSTIEELSDILGMDVTMLNIGCSCGLTICAGAYRTTTDFGDSSLNRPGQARKQMQSRLWQYGLVLAGGLALVGMGAYTFSARLLWNSTISGLESNMQTLTLQSQKTANYAANYKAYASKYDSYSTDWDTIFASLRTYNDNLALVLEELETTLPENSSVINMQVAADGLMVDFACETKEEAAYLIMALRKLQYADLLAISNLGGGGVGPATSYGSGETEAPPTEGSAVFTVTRASGLGSYLNQKDVVDAIHDMTETQQNQLKKTYGKSPASKTMDDLKNDNSDHAAALREMFVNNPYVALPFADLLMSDYSKDDAGILAPLVFEDAMNFMDSEEAKQIDTNREYMEIMVDRFLTRDAETMAATEELLRTDDYLESWYVYYIENGNTDPFPYLNMDKVTADLKANKSFGTGNSTLDAKLNKLVPADAWTYLENLDTTEPGPTEPQPTEPADPTDPTEGGSSGGLNISDEQMGKYLAMYISDGTTKNPMIDNMIKKYLNTGSTGYASLDTAIKDYIASGEMDDEMSTLVKDYMTTGTTGNDVLDELIEKYFTEGTTGNADLDAMLDDYIASGKLNADIATMADAYLKNGTTGNDMIDNMLALYIATGSSGNKKLDALLDGYLTGDKLETNKTPMEEQIAEMLKKYITEGTTGNAVADTLIVKWLATGSTGNEALDKKISDYINSGALNDTMKALAQKYIANGGKTGIEVLDKLLENYFNNGTTGNKLLDALLKKFMSTDTTLNNDMLNDLINQLLGGNNGTTGTGTGSGQAVDTRITFTVYLGYNDELKNTELTRKGLSYSDKIVKLEVEE